MKTYWFNCQLLSDVIISSDSATSNQKETLDHLPGVKFMGIVARTQYKTDDATSTLDLFHNGKVSFGNAYPVIGGKRSLPVPFSWFHAKDSGSDPLSKAIYVHHDLHKVDILTRKKAQLKQSREGYFTEDGLYLPSIPKEFSLKSAYDTELRRAKDQQMYGYFSLPKGSVWAFNVEDQEGKHAETIRQALVGKHSIGRSRSAEYGLVRISFVDATDSMPGTQPTSRSHVCYAESDCLFYDAYGQPTVQPDPVRHFHLPPGSRIVWEQSQVRSRNYQSWNGKRYNRDADRRIVEKGSVFVLETSEPVALTSRIRVGSQQNQGFGHILVGPDFLRTDENGHLILGLKEQCARHWCSKDLHVSAAVTQGESDDLVERYLRAQMNKVGRILDIDEEVNRFVSKRRSAFQGITKSQWGMLRNMARHVPDADSFRQLVFSQENGCLHRGQSQQEWRRNSRVIELEKILFSEEMTKQGSTLTFMIKLASAMVKNK